ncbi:MAG: hypothetical protein H6620_06355 [Halobacteriovoraceae bacterium]|nr:hypothetical protein [Halobacteriovoraceae bacterium]
MMEFKNKRLIKLKESNLKDSDILERYGLQEAIISSWEDFKQEINMPQLSLIGSEVCPHQSVQNSIDILAYDSIDNVPVVIELKRDKNKLQLLQAISYASMVATWNKDNYLAVAKSQLISEVEDLEDELSGIEDVSKVKIILIAEKFDPEVMISSDWLYSNFDLDITTFSINVFSKNDDIYFNFTQTYPLPELKDAYEMRSRKRVISNSDTSWDEIREQFEYDWAHPILDAFLNLSPGDTHRKRFPPLVGFKDVIPFDKISVSFRRNWVLVYLWGKPDNAEEILKVAIGNNADIGEWRDGHSIKLHSKQDGERFMSWLKIDYKIKKSA